MYFKEGDCWATWTYAPQNRPPDMKAALKDFQDAMRCVRREYKKRGYEVFWIRNIERGTKGAWHIHLIINEIGDTASIITKVWKKAAPGSQNSERANITVKTTISGCVYHKRRADSGKEAGRHTGKTADSRIKLQYQPEHAPATTKETVPETLEGRSKTEKRLLHCPDLRRNQPENRIQIPELYDDPAEQEGLTCGK